jgi:hypothetical protein
VLAFALIFVLVGASVWLERRGHDGQAEGYSPVVIRGGGFVTGLIVQGDSMYARTDVGGAYRFDKSNQRWEQMITTSSVKTDRRPSDYQVEALGAAPSNPSIVYMLVGSTSAESPGARVLSSHDAGRSWSIHPTDWYVGGNDAWRQSGARIAVDPSDPNVLFVGTRRNGLQLSRDGGGSWESVMAPNLFDATSDLNNIGVTSLLIEPSSPIVDGRHSEVWAGVTGIGLLRSLDAGRSWTVISPFSNGFVSDMALTSDDANIVCFYGVGEGSASFVRRVNGSGQVADISPPGDGRWLTVATDPNRSGSIVVAPANVQKGAGIFTTMNGEAPVPEWEAASSMIVDGSDGTTWPTESDVFDYLSTGQIRFFEGDVWFAEGMGMWRTRLESSDSIRWQFASDGIEEFVANAIIKPVGTPLLTAQGDRGLMRNPDPTDRDPLQGRQASFPYTSKFGSAWDITSSPTDPHFLAVILDDYQDLTGRTVPERRASAYSADGGLTWHRFAALANGTAPSDLLLGNIAVSAHDNNNIVWVPSNLQGLDTKVYYSRDGGSSWSSGQLNGLEAGQFLHNKYFQARKILAADPSIRGYFYALGSDATGAAILWKSTDGGASWNIAWNSEPPEAGTFGFALDSTLVAVGGYLIAAPGGHGGCFYRSRDGEQWERMCSIRDALSMGVGAPLSSSGNATLYTYGTVESNTGIYRSADYGASWQRLSGEPNGIYVGVRAIAGDPEVAGRLYVALAGGGYLVGQF